MGLFDFLKPKKEDKIKDMMDQMSASIFPKGEKDINACVDELLRILENKISRDEAKNIILKSVVISRMSDGFPKERLITHLKPYALHHFNETQLMIFWCYLLGILYVTSEGRKTPSDIKWDGSKYLWE